MTRGVRAVLAVYIGVFVWGTLVHLVDLTGGGHSSYALDAPAAVRAFFVALVVLDPLVAVLLWRRRPAGVVAAGLVMGADLAANGWVLGPDAAALWAPGLFCAFIAVTAVPLYQRLAGRVPAATPGTPPAVPSGRSGRRAG
ncbi:hypothetical protein ACWD33_27050 [Streptomyces xiamenensis]|uniref:hypothetical protein n=1 Tax=Streptomyces xiamenensis TaxID=408015 RepID=UPI001FE72A87|nr:hypothetical protein [Streptomyces xiamenensis]